jgi:hypothetical protein
VPAFRLKRMLLNLSPDRRRPGPSATSRWSVSQATGTYERECHALAQLGVRPPREFPFDLAVPALAMLVPLVVAVSGLNEVFTAPIPAGDRWLSGVMGTLFLTVVVVRLGWLYRMWRRRLEPSGPCMPFEVGIGSGLSTAKVERPVGVRMLVFVLLLLVVGAAPDPEMTLPQYLTTIAPVAALVASVPISFAWWWRVNRELRSVDPRPVRPRSTGRRLFMRVLTVVGFLTVLPAFIVTGRRIRRAQARAGLPETLRFGWLLLPGLLLHPLLVAYLQHELNKIWTVVGQPLDPWTGTPSASESDLTRRPPWLRSPRPHRLPDRPSQHDQHANPVLAADGRQTPVTTEQTPLADGL